MPLDIKTPYDHTPYDIFSDPNDPKVGVITPDSNRREIRAQHSRVMMARKQLPIEVAQALSVLTSVRERLKWDVFLSTRLSRSTELASAIERHKKPALPTLKQPDWAADLGFLFRIPKVEVQPVEVSISPQQNYDRPDIKPFQVEFDS